MKTIKTIWISFISMIITIGLPLQLSAQSEDITPGAAPGLKVDGYVILSNGDTLYGKIRWALKYVENNPVEIKFFAENGASKSFNASEIQGFGSGHKIWMDNDPVPIMTDVEDYLSIPSYRKGVPVFMHRLLKGRITIIQNRSSIIIDAAAIETNYEIDGIGFSFTRGEGLSIGPSYRKSYEIVDKNTHFSSYFVIKDNGAMVKVDKENYDDFVITLFSDCPAIALEIDKNPDLKKFRNFMLLTEFYNQICR
jgi:hypothetical protein